MKNKKRIRKLTSKVEVLEDLYYKLHNSFIDEIRSFQRISELQDRRIKQLEQSLKMDRVADILLENLE